MSKDIRLWMDETSGAEWYWYVKFLSGNDTLLNGTHQAGPYISNSAIFRLFPSLKAESENPRVVFPVEVDSHGSRVDVTVIWYNNRVRGAGTRNECRITNWGGSASPLLDPDATGSLCVFAFHKATGADADVCRVWLCASAEEEDAILDRVGPVQPGGGYFFGAGLSLLKPATPVDSPCALSRDQIPESWKFSFPDANTVVELAVSKLPSVRSQSPDSRLIRRRDCEFEIFRSVEEVVVLPRVQEGFATVDLFVDFANSVTNRRKSRSGASLELHAKHIFDEERLPHSHDEVSEANKRPDFLFPSSEAYRSPKFAAEKLRMLAVKTTCKDRWRQILDEADRIPKKHLLTLQEGISLSQFAQMESGGVTLVVPAGLHKKYHPSIQPKLLSLERFIGETALLNS